MTQERALAVLRAQRRALMVRRGGYWMVLVGIAAAGLWAWASPPYGLELGPVPAYLSAVIVVAVMVLADRRLPLVTEGSPALGVNALQPAYVVAGGAEGVAVRPAGAATATNGDDGRRWWSLARGQQPVAVGQQVWVNAELSSESKTPMVWLGDATQPPRVVWPQTTATQEDGTRLRLTGPDEAAFSVGAPAPPEVVAAARRTGRRTVALSALWVLAVMLLAIFAVLLDIRMNQNSSAVSGVALVLATGGVLKDSGPRLVAAWRMSRARTLRRAILAARRRGAPFKEDGVVTVRVAPDRSSSGLWSWTLVGKPPRRDSPQEIWLTESARPYRLAAIFLPNSGDGSPKLLAPNSPVREFIDREADVVDSPASRPRSPR